MSNTGIELFDNNTSNFTEISFDDANRESMITLDYDVINFDRVMEEYSVENGLSERPMSNDGLFDVGSKRVFVEFKNGRIQRNNAYELHVKIYDSLLVYSDIVGEGLSAIRNNTDYILVYNEDKNRELELFETKEEGRLRARSVAPSQSYETFADAVTGFAGEHRVRFGLFIFQKYCFDEVHTFTKDEFLEYLRRNGICA